MPRMERSHTLRTLDTDALARLVTHGHYLSDAFCREYRCVPYWFHLFAVVAAEGTERLS